MKSRTENLMPNGIPKWIRCYDNGGESIDSYTVVFTGATASKMADGSREYTYLAMSAEPFHPQGFGQHGHSQRMIDVNKWGFAPALGRKNHLGRRIRFQDLPEDCQKLVLRDYMEIWRIRKVELSRKPTAGEIKFGYGCRHFMGPVLVSAKPDQKHVKLNGHVWRIEP